MNPYVRAMICVPWGMVRTGLIKLLRGSGFHGSAVCAISPLAELTLDRGGTLSLGKRFRMRSGARLRVRSGAQCVIGDDVCINCGNIITCRDRIVIGDGTMLSPNVQIYDHDHDFRSPGGIRDNAYRLSPVQIGKNCWIGANTVILRGTILGDHCVVGAGSVLKGVYPDGSVIIQKRETFVR